MKSAASTTILFSLVLCCLGQGTQSQRDQLNEDEYDLNKLSQLGLKLVRVQPYSGPPGYRCTAEGLKKPFDCSYCFCSKKGPHGCVLEACVKIDFAAHNLILGEIEYGKDSCERGEIWKKDCNTCSCPTSRIRSEAPCTKMACPKGRTQESNSELNDESGEKYEEKFSQLGLRHYVFENETHCTPGSDFYLGCNPCNCQSSGIKRGSSCQNHGCPPFPALYDLSAKCTPGTLFKLDCNWCTCGEEGTVRGSGCTRRACHHSHP